MVHIRGHGIKDLVKFVLECLHAGGIPQLVPKYGGVELWSEKEHSPAVLVRCWGAGREVKGGIIVDLPESLIKESEQMKGDWKWILQTYAGVENPIAFAEKIRGAPETEFESILNSILSKLGATPAGTPGAVGATYSPF